MPRFGEWETDLNSSAGYTVVFDKYRDRKLSAGDAAQKPTVAAPATPARDRVPSHSDSCWNWVINVPMF